MTKGPYYRLVGRYSQRYLGRATSMSGNEMQKKLLFIATAGVDDYFSKGLNVRDKTAKGFTKTAVEKRLKAQQLNTAFRVYLSTLLILLGNQRGLLLKETGLGETEWVQLWRRVFDYQAADMAHINNSFLPEYQENGPDSLVASAFRVITESLAPAGNDLFWGDEVALRDSLLQDISAILRTLSP